MAGVYLAGSCDTKWRDIVKKKFPLVTFYDPSEHGLTHPNEFTVWDTYFIKQCGIVFGFMEVDNPSGYGLAMEIGFAKGLGKTIILVDEKAKVDVVFAKCFAIVHEISDLVFDDYNDGIVYLTRLLKQHVEE